MEHTAKNAEAYKPAVTKAVRLFLAGGLWICVGVMLLSLAVSWLRESARTDWLAFAGSGVVLASFVHHFAFLRIVDKNLARILSEDKKKCVFSFMPWKSYLVIPVMITMGMILRHSPIPKEYLAILYSGIGLALILSSVRYVRVFLGERRSGMRKLLFMSVACALLMGCDYTVPLVKKPEADIDATAVGLWQRQKEDGQMETLLVLPLSEKEYLVSFPSGSKNAMFARGCLWHNAAIKLVQLDWFGTAQGKLPTDSRTFQFASFTVEGNSIRVRLLNPEVVAKDVTSSDALAKAIADNKDNPRLFRDEMVFQKAQD